jgi:hypothetical protein
VESASQSLEVSICSFWRKCSGERHQNINIGRSFSSVGLV